MDAEREIIKNMLNEFSFVKFFFKTLYIPSATWAIGLIAKVIYYVCCVVILNLNVT